MKKRGGEKGKRLLKRLRSAPLRRLPFKKENFANESSISLHFTVKRPHSKYREDASNETSSRFEAAYRLFRRRHPNSVPITGQQRPPKDYSPLEYAEWVIWKARERWGDATWDNWFLGFYEKHYFSKDNSPKNIFRLAK